MVFSIDTLEKQKVQQKSKEKRRNIQIENYNIQSMNQDIGKKLQKQLAYGTVTRGDLPGDFEDYNVIFVKQIRRNLPTLYKLRFLSKSPGVNRNFEISIDKVNDPSFTIMLVKYTEDKDNGVVTARATNKINKKMILSVKKENREGEGVIELLQKQEEDSDSDIPHGKPLSYYIKDEIDETERPKKKVKISEQDLNRDESDS